MPSGTAQRPGDVVKTYSGQTVEVINTDAEGRLVLADVLWYCQEKFDPRFMIDLATLTGAMVVALGHEYAGLFSNDDELPQRLHAAGEATGEKLWRMPLGEAYDKLIKSRHRRHEECRRPARPARSPPRSSCSASSTASPGRISTSPARPGPPRTPPTVPKGATAFGVRLLDRLVADHYEG